MSDLSPDYFTKPVADVDPDIAKVLDDEARRQETTLEMIASENFVPQAILECQGSVLTNKYAEGYPGKRYYGGCEFGDVAETLAIDRAKDLFGAEHVNVQPHAGAQANAAAYHALLDPGDRILGMKLDHGGHLTHGMKINFSGKLYDIVAYGVREEDSILDMDALQKLAEEFEPKLILAGWSAYPRELDFERFREIADSVGALLMVDMAHFAGLVAAGEHPSPVPHADVVTTTTHKTLGGARGGMILCKEEFAKKINSAMFPGQQGGPLMHVIAGKAVTLKVAQSELFRERQRRTREGAAIVAEELLGSGVNVLTGGTDVHLVLVDLRDSDLDGQQAEDRLARDRHHREPQRRALRPAPARGLVGPARGHARARHPRLPGRRLPRGRQGHRGGAHRRLHRRRRRPSSPSAPARWPSASRSTRSCLPRRSDPPAAVPGGLFQIEAVSASRDGRCILDDLDLDIGRGPPPSSAPRAAASPPCFGSSTGWPTPTAGTIRFDGEDVRSLDPLALRRRACLVPQLPALLPGTRARTCGYGPAPAVTGPTWRAAWSWRASPATTRSAMPTACRWASSSA